MNKYFILFLCFVGMNGSLLGSSHYCKYKESSMSEYEMLMDRVKNLPEKDRALIINTLRARTEYIDIPSSPVRLNPPESEESFLRQLINSVLYYPTDTK